MEYLLDKLLEVRFWEGMGKDRGTIRKLSGFCSTAPIKSLESLIEHWEREDWGDIPVVLGRRNSK